MKKKKYSKNVESVVKEKRKNWFSTDKILLYFLGFLLVGLMVGSMFGVGNNEEEGKEYNGFNFRVGQGGWVVKIDNNDLTFAYAPWEVESIGFEDFSLGSRVYILFDPLERSEEDYDIRYLMAFLRLIGKSVNPACVSEEGCNDWPIKSCSSEGSIVYLKEGNVNKIYNDGSCVVLEGQDLLKVETFFYYKLLGVI